MIYKKLLLIIALLLSSSFVYAEAQLSIQKFIPGTSISFSSTQEEQSWIGIYKVNKTTEWENVLSWNWVNDGRSVLNILFLAAGEYEAKLFHNNSFIVEKTIRFSVENHPGNSGEVLKDQTVVNDNTITVKSLVSSYNQDSTDWIGIFKEGKSYTRANLEGWGYIPYGSKTAVLKPINEYIETGVYEMALFINDSYQKFGNTSKLTVIEQPLSIDYVNIAFPDQRYRLLTNNYNSVKQDKDWIALFRKDAEPIKENIIAWSYMKDGVVLENNGVMMEHICKDAKDTCLTFESLPTQLGDPSEYKIVLFSNDSYEVLATSYLE